MTIINYNPTLKGRFTRLAQAVLICSTFAKGVGIAYLVIGPLMVGWKRVVDESQRTVFNQFSLYGLPMGDLSEGVVFSIYFVFPLHTIFGYIGLLGVLCRNKLLILMYTGFLAATLALDIVLLVLTSILLNGLSTWVQESFTTSYSYYSNDWINADLKTAWNHLFVNLQCCGVTGIYNSCSGLTYTIGCWDKYLSPMTGYLWSLFLLFILSMIINIAGIVVCELSYQQLDNKPRCASGMWSQFGKFIYRSWKASKGKVIFTAITIIDTMTGLGLIVAGIVTLQSDFVSNSFLSALFWNLRFNNMYLPEVMIGLGATMITAGVLNTVTCFLGYNLLCFKSKSKIIIARILQLITIVVLIASLIFWLVMFVEVRHVMEFQLYKEFVGYNGDSVYGYKYTKSWQALFVTFTCCKVKGLEYRSSPVSAGIPEQCLYERTAVNSNLDYVGATIITGNYNQEFCEEKISDEIYKYQVALTVLFGMAIFVKAYTFGYLFTKDYQTGDVCSRVRLKETLLGLKSKKMQVALISILVIGLLLSAGILITGAKLRFDNVFGHTDIQQLFAYVYVGGDSLNFWMLALTYSLIGIGCVTLVLFGLACLSAALRVPLLYIVTMTGFLLAVVMEIIGIGWWINVKVEIDWGLQNQLRSVLQNLYRTDSTSYTQYYYGTVNLGFNFLFYEADCCGVDSIDDFYHVPWVHYYLIPTYPRTCHLSSDTVRWYTDRTMPNKSTVYTKGCGSEVRNSIHRYDVSGFVLLSLVMVAEILTMVLLDRRYKQTISPGQLRGAFSTLVHQAKGTRVNEIHLPGLSAKILTFVSLTAFLMVAEIILWIGALVQTFAPWYLKNGFLENLNAAEDIYNDQYPHLGYLMYGLLIGVVVKELVFVGIHLFTIFAIRALRKDLIYVSAVLLVIIIVCDIITLSLASLLINRAGYRCDDTFSHLVEFCQNNTGTLFILTGLFIGFNVVHIVLLCVLILIGILVSKENVTRVMAVAPVTELDVLSISNNDNEPSLDENRTVVNQSNDQPDNPSRNRRTSVFESTTGRRTSVARSNPDRRQSVATNVNSVGVRSALPPENDDFDNDDLETTYA